MDGQVVRMRHVPAQDVDDRPHVATDRLHGVVAVLGGALGVPVMGREGRRGQERQQRDTGKGGAQEFHRISPIG